MQKWVKLLLGYLFAVTLLIPSSIESKKSHRSRGSRGHHRGRRSHKVTLTQQRQKSQLQIPASTSEKTALLSSVALKHGSNTSSSELPSNDYNDGISAYRPEDKEILIDIIQKNLHWLSRGTYGFPIAYEYSPEYMFTHMSSFPFYPDNSLRIFVYRKLGKPVAFITYRENRNRGNIDLLAVDDNYRGRGYAEQLLKYIFEYARQQKNTDTIEIFTFADNSAAQKLYHKLGFSRLPQILRDYVVFEKKITREQLIVKEPNSAVGYKISQ